jgi:hypothetical protein
MSDGSQSNWAPDPATAREGDPGAAPEPAFASSAVPFAGGVTEHGLFGAVVCPLIRPELKAALANLDLWEHTLPPGETFPGRPDLPRPMLVFSFNCGEDAEIRAQLTDTFQRCPNVQAAFSELIVHFCDLPPEKDLYIRKPKGRAPKFGNKSGPNWQFYETMRMMRDKAQFVLLMEVDCQPLHPGWLRPLAQTCLRNSEAWVIGAHYSGASPLPWHVARHINGNALYQVGSDGFWAFIDDTLWPWMHDYIATYDSDLAYDCAWEMFLNREEMAYGGHYDWIVSRDILHRFKLTDTIVNIGGHAEQEGWYAWTREDLLRRFAGATVVHGPITESYRHLRGKVAVGRPESDGVAETGPNWLQFLSDAAERRYKRSIWIPVHGFRPGERISVHAAIDAGLDHNALLEIHDASGQVLTHDWLKGGDSWTDPRFELDLTDGHSFLTLTISIPNAAPAPGDVKVRDLVVTLSNGHGDSSRLHDFFW